VPFSEHQWYQNLAEAMQGYAHSLGIELEIADAAENLKDELVLRKLSIAHEASKLVKPGDVVLIDGGEVTTYLATALAGQSGITVITNAMAVMDALRAQADIALISTGGLLRHESQTLTGPTTEIALRELRADKLFLAVTGVSLDFGLSHTNLAEVAVKQAMIRAAREVILLADHTKFEQESVVQVAPLNSLHKVITDNALPASTRLDLTRLGIEIIIARA
jgi:DeoR family fructose operon transcriptional repressor